MKTITISLADSATDETVQAEYFQIEDGWIWFKTDDHKAVVAYPEARVTRIKSEESGPTIRLNLAAVTSAEDVEGVVKAAMAHAHFGLRQA